MKAGQWVVVVKHDEDPSLIGRLVVIVNPKWWLPDEDYRDCQIDANSTTFIKEEDLRPVTLSKQTREEMIKIYDAYYIYKKYEEELR